MGVHKIAGTPTNVRGTSQSPSFFKRDSIYREITLQITTLQLNESACKRPLVETEHQSSWYEGIEGCGIQCENPIFTTEEHTRIHRFVGAFGSLSFICSLFTMVGYLAVFSLSNKTSVSMSLYSYNLDYSTSFHSQDGIE